MLPLWHTNPNYVTWMPTKLWAILSSGEKFQTMQTFLQITVPPEMIAKKVIAFNHLLLYEHWMKKRDLFWNLNLICAIFQCSFFFLLCYFSAPLKPQLFFSLFRSGRKLPTAIQQYLPNQLPMSSCSSLPAGNPSFRLHSHALSAQEIPLKRSGFTLRIASNKNLGCF